MTPARRIGWLLAAAALLAIGLLTLQPRPELAPLSEQTRLWCLVCGSQGLVDVLLNVLLFVPLGVGLRLAAVRPRRAVLLAAGLTLAIELLQLRVIAGRDSSLSDLLTNTLGAGLGFAAAGAWRELLFPAPHVARRLAALWAAALLAISAATVISIAPSMPAPPYWGQWTPELGGFAQHEGTVHSAVVDGIPVRSGRLPASAALADSLAGGEVEVVVEATLAAPPPRIAPIFRVVDGHGRQALLLAQDGRDLVVETGTRSERLRLRAITVRIPAALPASERVRLSLASDRSGYRIFVETRGGRRSFSLPRSSTWGWALLLPFGTGPGGSPVPGALWLAALFAPLGWWMAGAFRSAAAPAAVALAAAVLAGSLAAVPLALGMPVAPAPAWLGGLLGWAAGTLGARKMRKILQEWDL